MTTYMRIKVDQIWRKDPFVWHAVAYEMTGGEVDVTDGSGNLLIGTVEHVWTENHE